MEEKKIYKDPFLVVLEGADATGKHTQSRRLLQSFETQCPKNAPVPYMTSFPVYDSPSSYFVTNYLSNAYDSIYYDNEPINVKLICDFYAMDHFDGWFNRNVPDNDHHYSYDQAYRECHPIILDRSWISNMIYQPILLFTRMLHKDKESPENIEQLIVDAFEYSIHNNFYNMKTYVKLPYMKFTRLDLSEILLRYKAKLKADHLDINFDTNYIIGSFYNSIRLVIGYLIETDFEKLRLPIPDRIINLGFRDYSIGRKLLENRDSKKDKYETNYAYLALINYLSPFIFNYLAAQSYFVNCKICQVYCDRLDLDTHQFTIATIDDITHAIIDALHHKETKND